MNGQILVFKFEIIPFVKPFASEIYRKSYENVFYENIPVY